MKTSEALLRAAEVQERDGFCTGTVKDSTGRHCAQGSIAVAVGASFDETRSDTGILIHAFIDVDKPGSVEWIHVNTAFGKYLKEKGLVARRVYEGSATWYFNDDNDGPTVVQTLKDAAKYYEEKESNEE